MLNEISVMCFLSVGKHLSFTKAAEEVFMSRQAVSKTILSLEKRLGVKLFDRTTSVIELTVEGELYLDFFRNMAHDFEVFTETIGKTNKPMVRMLIAYELGIIIDNRILEIVGEFKRQKDYLDLKIRRYEPQVIENKLLGGHLEMAFTSIPAHSKILKDKTFSYVTLEYAEYVIATSKDHPKVNENTVFSDFNGEPSVYWNWSMDINDDIICRKNYSAGWSDVGITVIPSIQCTSLSSAYTELLLGNAVMLSNAKNELCTLPGIITYPLPKREIFCCVWNRNAPSDIKEFAEIFRKYEINPKGSEGI